MRNWLLLLYICILFGSGDLFASGGFAFEDYSDIKNPVVRTMAAESQHFYLFVKNTCGVAAPMNSKILNMQLNTFVDSAVATLALNIRYWKGRYHNLEGKGLSVEVQRLLSSPGAQVALQECYGDNEGMRSLYYKTLIDNDNLATATGVGVNLIGGAIIFKALIKVGWLPLATGLRKLYYSAEQIESIRKIYVPVAALALGGLGTMSAHYLLQGQTNDMKEEAADYAKRFSCENALVIPERVVNDDIQSLAHSNSDFWKEALNNDLDTLMTVFRDCKEKNLSSAEQKQIQEKIEKYNKIRGELL